MGPGIIVPIEATPLNYPDASKVQKFFPGKNFKDKVEKWKKGPLGPFSYPINGSLWSTSDR